MYAISKIKTYFLHKKDEPVGTNRGARGSPEVLRAEKYILNHAKYDRGFAHASARRSYWLYDLTPGSARS